MDIVIPYVNCSDENWLQEYKKEIGEEPPKQRFRDYGTLKYLLRSIDLYVPFVNNVFLVVSSESQVPKWIKNVNVVFHKDIIPSKYLPTFNSSCINMFIHNIKELDEYFVLCNDDEVFLKPYTEDMFFVDGRPVYNIKKEEATVDNGVFSSILKNSIDEFHNICGCNEYYKNWHLPIAYLKSVWKRIWKRYPDNIERHLVGYKLRNRTNMNEWFFNYIQIYRGISLHRKLEENGFLLLRDNTTREDIVQKMKECSVVCFNDAVHLNENVFTILNKELENKLPGKSKFEV